MADLLAVGYPEVATALADDEPALGWTVVLRRKPARIVDGRPEGGYTDAYELICCECGDDPDQDYRDVPRRLQRVRGPYAVAAGIAAYARHVRLRHGQQPDAGTSRTRRRRVIR
jgi:hypothetical protein